MIHEIMVAGWRVFAALFVCACSNKSAHSPFLDAALEIDAASNIDAAPDGAIDLCKASYTVGGAPNPDLGAVLAACPQLASALVWVDTTNTSVPYASWTPDMQARLASLYGTMLSGGAISDLACPDPRGADSSRAPPASNDTNNPPMMLFFTTAQASDMYLASAAHALVIEVKGAVPWSLLDYPAGELAPLLDASTMVTPTTQLPRPFGSPIAGATYQVPPSHVDSLGFVCDPRVGYDFIRGTTSKTGADLVGADPTATLANLTFFMTQNSVHGFPTTEPWTSFSFSLTDRLHLGLDLSTTPATQAPYLVERVGCHSTAELLEELARFVNIPLRNVASNTYDWTDTTAYPYRQNSHRALAYAWTRPAEFRVLPHADFVNATALWPNYRSPFTAMDYFTLVWLAPATYVADGIMVDTTMPVIPILPANSQGSYETYPDFGRVLSVLTTSEARYYLRKDACSWDTSRAYCINPAGGTSAFQSNNPYGGYSDYSDPVKLQAGFDAAAACIAAYPGGCASVPSSYPSFTATNYLP